MEDSGVFPLSLRCQPYLADVQRDDVSAHLGLRRHHGRLLHLVPIGSQVGQPQVVVHKLEPAERQEQRKGCVAVDRINVRYLSIDVFLS